MRVSQHTAQASAKALLSTRLYLLDIGVLLISGATQMIDLKIDCGVRSAVGQLYDVATMPRRIFGNRQRIYPDGHDDLPSHVPKGWARPALQMNNRSQQRMVELINKIWNSDIEGRTQPKTGIPQHSRTEKSGGTVRIFVGNTKVSTAEKIRKEAECALVMAAQSSYAAWRDDARGYKTLALEHKLAAKRGDFFEAYYAMDLLDKDAATPKSNGEQTGPSMVRPLLGPMLELAEFLEKDGAVNEFSTMEVLS